MREEEGSVLLLNKLDDIIKEEEEKARKDYINDFKKNVEPIIVEFISTHKLPIFSSMAFLKWTAGKAKIPMNLYYYNVYSPNARADAFALADLLFARGVSWIELKRDYDDSLMISWKGRKIIGIYYLMKDEFNKLDVIKGGGLLYVQLEHLMIEIMKIFTNPRYEIDKWITYYDYYKLLEKMIPLKAKEIEKPPEVRNPEILKCLKKIEENFIKKANITVIGSYAYKLMIEYAGGKRSNLFIPAMTNVFEVLSAQPLEDIEKIKKILGLGSGPDLVIKKSNNHLGFYKAKYSIFFKNYKLVEIYDASEECVPFVKYRDIRLGNLHVILKYLYIGIYIARKINDTRLIDRMETIIYFLKEASYYGKRKNLFAVFQIDCVGKAINIEREFRINKWNGNIKDKGLVIQSYKPELKKKLN